MNTEKKVNRRQFLAVSLMAAFGLVQPVAGASCPLTQENPSGPFYLPGAPFQNQLAPNNLPGERLRISGRVLAVSSCEPLDGAIVDVWHASSGGYYYGLEATHYRVSETWVRPRVAFEGTFDIVLA
jgi:protocatechuate 3,4-dioxygenase beta subunit